MLPSVAYAVQVVTPDGTRYDSLESYQPDGLSPIFSALIIMAAPIALISVVKSGLSVNLPLGIGNLGGLGDRLKKGGEDVGKTVKNVKGSTAYKRIVQQDKFDTKKAEFWRRPRASIESSAAYQKITGGIGSGLASLGLSAMGHYVDKGELERRLKTDREKTFDKGKVLAHERDAKQHLEEELESLALIEDQKKQYQADIQAAIQEKKNEYGGALPDRKKVIEREIQQLEEQLKAGSESYEAMKNPHQAEVDRTRDAQEKLKIMREKLTEGEDPQKLMHQKDFLKSEENRQLLVDMGFGTEDEIEALHKNFNQFDEYQVNEVQAKRKQQDWVRTVAGKGLNSLEPYNPIEKRKGDIEGVAKAILNNGTTGFSVQSASYIEKYGLAQFKKDLPQIAAAYWRFVKGNPDINNHALLDPRIDELMGNANEMFNAQEDSYRAGGITDPRQIMEEILAPLSNRLLNQKTGRSVEFRGGKYYDAISGKQVEVDEEDITSLYRAAQKFSATHGVQATKNFGANIIDPNHLDLAIDDNYQVGSQIFSRLGGAADKGSVSSSDVKKNFNLETDSYGAETDQDNLRYGFTFNTMMSAFGKDRGKKTAPYVFAKKILEDLRDAGALTPEDMADQQKALFKMADEMFLIYNDEKIGKNDKFALITSYIDQQFSKRGVAEGSNARWVSTKRRHSRKLDLSKDSDRRLHEIMQESGMDGDSLVTAASFTKRSSQVVGDLLTAMADQHAKGNKYAEEILAKDDPTWVIWNEQRTRHTQSGLGTPSTEEASGGGYMPFVAPMQGNSNNQLVYGLASSNGKEFYYRDDLSATEAKHVIGSMGVDVDSALKGLQGQEVAKLGTNMVIMHELGHAVGLELQKALGMSWSSQSMEEFANAYAAMANGVNNAQHDSVLDGYRDELNQREIDPSNTSTQANRLRGLTPVLQAGLGDIDTYAKSIHEGLGVDINVKSMGEEQIGAWIRETGSLSPSASAGGNGSGGLASSKEIVEAIDEQSKTLKEELGLLKEEVKGLPEKMQLNKLADRMEELAPRLAGMAGSIPESTMLNVDERQELLEKMVAAMEDLPFMLMSMSEGGNLNPAIAKQVADSFVAMGSISSVAPQQQARLINGDGGTSFVEAAIISGNEPVITQIAEQTLNNPDVNTSARQDIAQQVFASDISPQAKQQILTAHLANDEVHLSEKDKVVEAFWNNRGPAGSALPNTPGVLNYLTQVLGGGSGDPVRRAVEMAAHSDDKAGSVSSIGRALRVNRAEVAPALQNLDPTTFGDLMAQISFISPSGQVANADTLNAVSTMASGDPNKQTSVFDKLAAALAQVPTDNNPNARVESLMGMASDSKDLSRLLNISVDIQGSLSPDEFLQAIQDQIPAAVRDALSAS